MRFFRVLTYVVVAAAVVYLAWLLALKKDYRVGGAGMRESYQRLIANDALREDWKKLNCSVDINQSLAQNVHVVSYSGVSCIEELGGEQYGNFKKPFSCNVEDAARIDAAVRKKNDCTFQLGTPLDAEVRDYHAIVLVCVANFTNWNYVGGGPCPLEYPQSVIYAVVDERGNVFY